MKKSLTSADKIALKSEFDYIRAEGKKYVAGCVLLVVAPSPDGKLRCGVVCGKKYSNSAVKRNRARRLLWESFRLLKSQIGPAHCIMIPRRRIAVLKQPDVQKALNYLFRKAGLIEDC
ncbi:ribonuclease P protein component [Lentisphaerota bacterium ZTH]|nr:ribonuclease P protein component [Lentisphaerota bacterium]WET06826.1 ribonuclease P protein component [Lentisphaerota bacterium ZTH]